MRRSRRIAGKYIDYEKLDDEGEVIFKDQIRVTEDSHNQNLRIIEESSILEEVEPTEEAHQFRITEDSHNQNLRITEESYILEEVKPKEEAHQFRITEDSHNQNLRITEESYNLEEVEPIEEAHQFRITEDSDPADTSITEELSRLLESFSLEDNRMNSEAEKLMQNQAVIHEDTVDFIEENSLDYCTIEDLDAMTTKVESQRTQFRLIHKELQNLMKENYEENLSKSYLQTIDMIKKFIMNIKAAKASMRRDNIQQEKEKDISKKLSKEFMLKEIEKEVNMLIKEFDRENKDLSYEELMRRKSELQGNIKRTENVSVMLKDLMQSNLCDQRAELAQVTNSYHHLESCKQKYNQSLWKAIENQDILKYEKFSPSSLNIKLSLFNGYNSNMDIYSFQSDFEKIYKKTSPKDMLPDLLKNNFLTGPALALVKDVNSIDEIWSRLKSAYGDPKLILSKKMSSICEKNLLFKIKDPEKLIEGISKIISNMKDLMKLADEHGIQNNLYYGNAIEYVYKTLGDYRLTRWFAEISEKTFTEEQLWNHLILFLQKEMKVQQEKMKLNISENIKSTERHTNQRQPKPNSSAFNVDIKVEDQLQCFICNQKNHCMTKGPKGSKVIQYFSCQMFAEMKPAERFNLLKTKGFCHQCLYPGALLKYGKHKDGKCQHDFTCKHESHNKYPVKKHVLVCQEHAHTDDNLKLLEEYKRRCIPFREQEIQDFTRNIRISFHTKTNHHEVHKCELKSNIKKSKEVKDASCYEDNKGVYMLQTIKVDEKCYNLFYDSGCSDLVVKYQAISRLGERAKKEYDGPISIGGIGQVQTQTDYGIYQIQLPLYNQKNALLSGVCLDEIAGEFPLYPLQGEVESDIRKSFHESGGNLNKLPSLPNHVGGTVDVMIGIKYLRYHPTPIYQLPSGLTIYKSVFYNADGSRGVIGGPHKIFNEIEKQYYGKQKSFLSQQYYLYRTGLQVNPDVSTLKTKDDYFEQFQDDQTVEFYDTQAYSIKRYNQFYKVENAGTEITYRCSNCRNCSECKNHSTNDEISIKEELEQEIIKNSVTVDINKRSTIAYLPLLHKPEIKLAHNKNVALKVYNQQLKKLQRCENDKSDIIAAEKKLQDMGFVEFVKNLSKQQQTLLNQSQNQYFIPWRAVWNTNSLSTPCRIVFDASQATNSGLSLNDIVAKGKNGMNKLVEIFIRWSSHLVAFHTDVQKMYNSIKLHEQHWCLQRYIWHNELDPNKIPEEKVIKTLIYGVRSSGNQAEFGIRETARLSAQQYPEVCKIINNDIYVDDCLTGENSTETAHQRADELEIVLSRGGFSLKGITFSKQPPCPHLSEDGCSIKVAGVIWYPEKDQISLDVNELNFAKKMRGKKPDLDAAKIVPEKLTRRHCVSKVAEIFDVIGKLTPITAGFKLDLHELVLRKFDWDDTLPDNLRKVWINHFEMMQEITNIRYNRCIIPEDAISLDIQTIDTGDASKSIACAAIYARLQRQNGEYSCQLIFARSKILPEETTQPRAELVAATLNTHTGEVVKKALKDYHKQHLKLTDSQIVLHWINNDDKWLKTWVRNRIIDIRRFTSTSDWRYVPTQHMIADMGTRRGAKLEDVLADSVWMKGYDWMRQNLEDFPTLSISEIKLTNDQEAANVKEQKISTPPKEEANYSLLAEPFVTEKINYKSSIPSEVAKRYQFSSYIIDPNKFRYSKVINILSLVIKFIQLLHQKLSNHGLAKGKLKLVKTPATEAEVYFFKKATKEIEKFVDPQRYKRISTIKDNILYYTGRILPNQQINNMGNLTSIMLDLTETTFCVPIIDRNSPLAYSIVNEVHWHHKAAKHSGVETTLRFVLQKSYIIDGRELIKLFRRKCDRCKYLMKKIVDVAMGPISSSNLNLAPAFYSTQVDICGPFLSYSNHHKRTTVKIWLVVFCCTTTSATKIKVMDDYSSNSFIQSFIRFSCEVGYPKYLLPDEGSQLVAACDQMRLNFCDIKQKLHEKAKIEFNVCPVGGHHIHGKVERKIKEIKESLEKTINNDRLSVLQWETLTAEISNSINDLPLALGNITGNFEQVDLLTPNRLLLGRNNDRSPVNPLEMSTKFSKVLQQNFKIFNVWFERWLISHVPKLMHQPKWFQNDRDLKVGDVVLFLKRESKISNDYQYGIIDSVEIGHDGKIRKVHLRYRNSDEKVNRFTHRAVRSLILIHPVDELSLSEELMVMSKMN